MEGFGAFFVSLVALSAFVFFQWRLLWLRHFDEDELEHMHAAWCTAKGMVPYRDFGEVHPPFLYYLLSPFFAFFDVERGIDNALGFIFFGRILMWAVMILVLGLTVWLGKRVAGARAGFVAAALLASTTFFQDKALEVRPDNPALVFWLTSILCTLMALRHEDKNHKTPVGLFLTAGFCLGMAIISTQKILMVAPGLGVAAALYLYEGQRKKALAIKLGGLFSYLGGALLPIAAVSVFFQAHHALGAFYHHTLIMPLRWKVRLDPFDYVRQFFCQNPFFLLAAATGFAASFRRPKREDRFFMLATFSLVAGIFILQEPYRQYYMTFLPLLAVYASIGLFKWIDWAAVFQNKLSPTRRYAVLDGAAALLLVLALFYPLRAAYQKAFHGDTRIAEERISKIRFIMENTGPQDTVLEAWPVYGVFRPHAFFYFFPNSEIRPMIDEGRIDEFFEKLRSGAVRPKLIGFDRSVKALSPEITSFIETHYEPTRMPEIWMDKNSG